MSLETLTLQSPLSKGTGYYGVLVMESCVAACRHSVVRNCDRVDHYMHDSSTSLTIFEQSEAPWENRDGLGERTSHQVCTR